MKKTFLIAGSSILLFALSFSGCFDTSDNEESSNNDLVSFYDLDNWLYKYANKEIMVEGNVHCTLGKSWNKSTYIGKFQNLEDGYNDFGAYRIDLIIPNTVNLLHNTDYIITGIAREPETYGDNPIIEVISAELEGYLSDDERFWAGEHGLSFVEEYASDLSQYGYYSETGLASVHHGIFNATVYLSFYSEEDIIYKNKYVVSMELKENSDMTKKESWYLISIDEEIDIFDKIPDI